MNICEYAATYIHCHKITVNNFWEDDFSNMPRPYHSLAYLLKGELEGETENGIISLKPGDILFVPYQIKYKLRWNDAVTYSCHFNFPSFSDAFGNKDFPLQKLSGFEYTKSDFEYISENFNNTNNSIEILSKFYNLCSLLYPHLNFTEKKITDERIETVMEYINKNYFKNTSIDELAKLANMSSSRFFYCFKKETGMTPVEYKNSVSIRHASLLLLCNNNKSIEEISAVSGFESSAYFRRVFKSVTGLSPREYRKTMITAL